MAIDYRDQSQALTGAAERSDSAGDDTAASFLTDVLADSAGQSPAGVTYYRPYYAAAVALATATYRPERTPEADFRETDKQIRALLAHQAALDRSLNLTVPPGMEAAIENVTGGRQPAISGHTDVIARF